MPSPNNHMARNRNQQFQHAPFQQPGNHPVHHFRFIPKICVENNAPHHPETAPGQQNVRLRVDEHPNDVRKSLAFYTHTYCKLINAPSPSSAVSTPATAQESKTCVRGFERFLVVSTERNSNNAWLARIVPMTTPTITSENPYPTFVKSSEVIPAALAC